MECTTSTNQTAHSSLYGSVVWAKVSRFPWWPCYVYDPDEFDAKENVSPEMKALAKKSIANDNLILYFYGDIEKFGFTKIGNIRAFTPETYNIFSGRASIDSSFKQGLVLALRDISLPTGSRLAWSRRNVPSHAWKMEAGDFEQV